MSAPVGHTFAQGASSHCRHWTGVLTLEVFTSFRRGMKYAGASFDKASGAECANTQATSHVRHPIHFPGSAITSLFISSPASPTETPKTNHRGRGRYRNRYRNFISKKPIPILIPTPTPIFSFEPAANHAGIKSCKSSASARTESATAGLIGSPNPICAGWIPIANISEWLFSLM
jgi:hypothetical protein